MLIRLPPSLTARLDFEAAVRAEIAAPIDALPSRTVEFALASHESQYAALVEAQCTSGFDVDAQETVLMPKPGHIGRYRTITTLPFRERVVLRALTDEISPDVPAFDRSWEANERFQRAPLATDLGYIVIADVASFYFNVGHEMLASRIVDVSARADTAQVVIRLLGALLGKDHGLPQNFGPSEVLSELIISPVERRMLRGGIPTYRTNDDFRLALPTWGEALEALELLQQEVNRLGLDLNGEKSRILRRETYERNLSLSAEYLSEALAADIDYQVINPYTDTPIAPAGEEEPDELEVEPVLTDHSADAESEPDDSDSPSPEEVAQTFTVVFDRIAAKRLEADERSNPFERTAYRQATATVLSILASVSSDGALEGGSHLVAVDPLLARQFAFYLRSLKSSGADTSSRVDAVIERFRGHVPSWTLAWLTEALLDPETELTVNSYGSLDTFVGTSAPAVLRARAVLALAVHGYLERDDLTRLLDEFPAVAQPDIVAALAVGSDGGEESDIHRLLAGDRLLTYVFDSSLEHGVV
jgi:hypothetical protein